MVLLNGIFLVQWLFLFVVVERHLTYVPLPLLLLPLPALLLLRDGADDDI